MVFFYGSKIISKISSIQTRLTIKFLWFCLPKRWCILL